jgi:hypothetical protein
MTNSTLKKFLVLYLVPTQVMGDWAKTDPETRKSAEVKMRNDWDRLDEGSRKNDHPHRRCREDQGRVG